MADSPAAEIPIDEPLIRALLRAQAPDLAGGELHLVTEGWDNAIWRLGDDLAVRLPRREAAACLIRHEQEHLPAIAARLTSTGVRVPAPVHHGTPSASFPWAWSVVPWIPGSAALEQPRRDRTSWAPRLASALRRLNAPAPASFPINPVRGVPLAVRDDSVRSYAAASAERDRAEALLTVWAAGLAVPPHQGAPLWIHGDMHPGNIVVDGEQLSGIVDFGDVTAGDPAYDLAAAWIVFDDTGRALFRDASSGIHGDDTWTRARAWAAAMALILLAHSDDRPEYAALGAEIAAQVALPR